MITITYNRQDLSVTVNGHSGYAEIGQDIVCASVSSLTYALAKFAEKIYRDGKLYFEPNLDVIEGKAEISVVVRNTFEYETRLVFDAICEGYELIAKEHPNNVEVKRVYPQTKI